MITLEAAAATFNKVEFTDIDSLNPFVAQLLPFNDSTRSGPTSRRRIMETAPEVTPPGVVIQVATSEVFLTAEPSHDFFKEGLVRNKRPIIPSDGEYTIKTVEEILNSSVGVSERGALSYSRREVLEDSSDFLGGYSAVFPSTVSLVASQYVIKGTNYYRARAESHVDELGFSNVELVLLPNAVQTLDIVVKGVYDPVTETSLDVSTPVLCVVEERSKSYENTRMDALKTEDGDFTVSTLHACEVGDLVSIFKIIHKRVAGNVNILHCRRP